MLLYARESNYVLFEMFLESCVTTHQVSPSITASRSSEISRTRGSSNAMSSSLKLASHLVPSFGLRNAPGRMHMQWLPQDVMRQPPRRRLQASRHSRSSNIELLAQADGAARSTPISEARCLGVLCSALVALSALACATRGTSGVTPPLAVCREVLAGGLAAAIGETIFFPLEVIKVRLQASKGKGAGFLDELGKLLGGASALDWAATPGVVAGVLRAVVYHGLRLGLFPALRRTLTALLAAAQGSDATLSLGAKIFVGAVCGGIGSALCNPLDLVKARLAAQPKQHANSLAALTTIARDEGGAAALWRGGGATTLRAACGSGAQLATYDGVKRLAAAHLAVLWPVGRLAWLGGLRSGLPILLATVASAAAYVTAAAPADLVKTRLMLSSGSSSGGGMQAGQRGGSYRGPLDCLRRSVREEGIGILFCGWGASFARLLPVLLLVIPLLEALRSAFGVGPF